MLIDRTLPIRRSAIDARASAVQAAVDALEAIEEAHFEGRSDLSLVLMLIDDLATQRRAFLADVRVYNYEIAEYAMTAPTPNLDPQGLASMLIKPSGTARPSAIAGGASSGTSGGIERAGFNQPINTSPTSPLQAVPEGQILLPPPPVGTTPPGRNEPTLAPPQSTQPQSTQPQAPQQRAPRQPRIGVTKADGAAPPSAEKLAATTREAARPLLNEHAAEGNETQTVSQPTYLYPALRQMTSEDQARQLALVLCWEPMTASFAGNDAHHSRRLSVGRPRGAAARRPHGILALAILHRMRFQALASSSNSSKPWGQPSPADPLAMPGAMPVPRCCWCVPRGGGRSRLAPVRKQIASGRNGRSRCRRAARCKGPGWLPKHLRMPAAIA